jgi:hypothetical protein
MANVTPTMIDAGLDVLAMHSLMADWQMVVADVYSAMRALEPAPGPDPADIIFAPKRLADWPLPSNSVSDSGCTIGEVRTADVGIPAASSEYVIRAKVSGSGSDFARMQFNHQAAGVPTWGEGTDIWYSASFYLPVGFYAAKNSSNDIMRWDCYVNGENDMQGGLGMGSDDGLYIMSNWPYTRPLESDVIIPEGEWTAVEVHQVISEFDGKALNEIYVNGVLTTSSGIANYKGSAYPANERAINRLRVGLVSEGSVSVTNTLYFDGFVISKVQMVLPST